MGEIKNKKPFKQPITYYGFILFYCIGLPILFLIIMYVFNLSENEAYSQFANRTLTGDSQHRFSIFLTNTLVKTFGKMGLVVLLFLIMLLGIYLLIQEIKEFKRYKQKCRLYHEGLIENFYDIYDDYERQSLLTKIKNLFLRKNKKKYKNPTKKELKDIEDKMKNMIK